MSTLLPAMLRQARRARTSHVKSTRFENLFTQRPRRECTNSIELSAGSRVKERIKERRRCDCLRRRGDNGRLFFSRKSRTRAGHAMKRDEETRRRKREIRRGSSFKDPLLCFKILPRSPRFSLSRMKIKWSRTLRLHERGAVEKGQNT